MGEVLVGGLLVIIGGALTATYQWFTAKETIRTEARVAEHSELRRLLGAVSSLMIPINPDRVGMNFGEQTFDEIADHRATWDAIDAELAGFALLHPSEETREGIAALRLQIHNTLHWNGWVASDLSQGHQSADALKTARDEYKAAQAAMEQVSELLRAQSARRR